MLTVVEMLIFIVIARFFFRKRIHRTPAGRDHPDHRFSISAKGDPEAPSDEKKNADFANSQTYHPDYHVNGVKGDAVAVSYNNNNAVSFVNDGVDDVDNCLSSAIVHDGDTVEVTI